MNAEQHTSGKLQAIHGGYLTIVGTGERIGRCGIHGPWMENARRLTACWNACQGLSTELLENITTVGDTLLDRFAQHQKTERELKAQRDQLLEALSQLVKAEQRAANLSFCADTYAQESVRLQIYDAMKAAQAAIAACQPKTTVAHLPSDDTEGGAV
jgi:hypothetical protein